MTKTYSPACERNSEPIARVIGPLLSKTSTLLEIGSGTGQHAVYFGQRFPHLSWQTSDIEAHHAGIQAWINDAALINVQSPLPLQLGVHAFPAQAYDAVFTANTCHIMAWPEVEIMFAGVTQILNRDGLFLIYGPFNYAGKFTSASNEEFDRSLKQQAAHRGLRDFEALCTLALSHGLRLQQDIEMPANNRLLVFEKC